MLQGRNRRWSAVATQPATWLLGCCLLAAGCGYRPLVGSAPFGRQRLSVLPFAEAEPNGMSAPMAVALSRRLAADGTQVVSHGDTDGVLTGTLHVGNAPSAALRTVQIYAVVAQVHAELRDRNDVLLWQRDLQLKEEFLPTDPALDVQPLVSEARRRTALARLAEQAAGAVHDALALDSHVAMQEVSPCPNP
jgi:hypothetical protein